MCVYKKDLARAVANKLREEGARKLVTYPRMVFHMSDDAGNKKDFVMRESAKELIYTYEDCNAIIEAVFDVIVESIRRGENVGISGFGTFGVRYAKGRNYIDVVKRKPVYLPGHYASKFITGKNLKNAISLLNQDLKDGLIVVKDDDSFEDEENILSVEEEFYDEEPDDI